MPNLVEYQYCEDYSALDLSVKNYSYINVDKLHDLKFVTENKNSLLSVTSLNAISLLGKMSEIEIFLNKCQTQNIDLFDLIAVQETWLDETTESLVSIPGYSFISKSQHQVKLVVV